MNNNSTHYANAHNANADKIKMLEHDLEAVEMVIERGVYINDITVAGYYERAKEALENQIAIEKGSIVISSDTDDGWLPIESAPKDGTDILVSDKFGEVNQVVWLHCDELWASIGGKCDVWNYLTSEPSHWMPLPQPPKEQMEKSDEE